ncbi:stress adaptor protein CpxP [Erwinia endophytica]|uniref:cell-envelope stress modulator CpxP n=1 Tax=Erwinia endophytica TaxID=1563158 RepID=UPI001265DF63|nr:cell-envelope stress modulator CpxP [Erwinia endophytica]KAB8310507.1 stress adaptor protein CpxP [Erwinia endophytica]
MRKVTAVVVVPTLILSFSTAWATEVTTTDEMHQDNAVPRSMAQIPQSHMFDGISLTEQQRQQMRDLMQQARHERSPISISDLEQLHDMIIADKFDETAYRARLDKIAQAEVARQVEIAHVRNQMYHLLTPAQQDVLNQKHQQRMDEMRKLASMPQASSLQAVSSTQQ